MAIITPGVIVSDIRGSVGGATFTRSLAGNVIRARVRPTRNPTANQVRTTADHAIKVRHWRNELTDANRVLWNIAALSVQWRNSLGVQYAPSGFQLFMRQATPIPGSPFALPTVPPTLLKSPSLPLYLFWHEALDRIYLGSFAGSEPPADGYLTIWHSLAMPPTWYHHGGPSVYLGIRSFSSGVLFSAYFPSAVPAYRPCRLWFRVVTSLTRYTQSDPVTLSISIPPEP